MNSTTSARDIIQLKRNINNLNTTILDLLLSAKNETSIRHEEYIAPIYASTEAVRMMHLSPRFGHTNNFLSIISFDHSKTTNYVTGLFIMSIIILLFFLLSLIILAICACVGRKKAGWLSGHRPLCISDSKPLSTATDDNGNNDDDDNSYDSSSSLIYIERLVKGMITKMNYIIFVKILKSESVNDGKENVRNHISSAFASVKDFTHIIISNLLCTRIVKSSSSSPSPTDDNNNNVPSSPISTEITIIPEKKEVLSKLEEEKKKHNNANNHYLLSVNDTTNKQQQVIIDNINNKIMHSNNNYDNVEGQLEQEEVKSDDMNNYEIVMMNMNTNNDHCSSEVNNNGMHNNIDHKEDKLILKELNIDKKPQQQSISSNNINIFDINMITCNTVQIICDNHDALSSNQSKTDSFVSAREMHLEDMKSQKSSMKSLYESCRCEDDFLSSSSLEEEDNNNSNKKQEANSKENIMPMSYLDANVINDETCFYNQISIIQSSQSSSNNIATNKEEDNDINKNTIMEDDDYEKKDYHDCRRKAKKQLKRIRVGFLSSSILALIFTIFFGYFSKQFVNNCILTVGDSLQQANVIIERGLNATYAGYISLENANTVFNTVTLELLDPKCAALEEVPLQQTLQLVNSWRSLSNALNSTLLHTMDSLNTTNNVIDRLSSNIHKLDSAITILIAIAAVEFLIIFFVTSGLLTVWFRCNSIANKLCRRFLRYFVLPSFILILFLNCIFTAVSFSVSSIGGDFCIDSPDNNVIALIHVFIDQLGVNMAKLIGFYVSGCPKDDKQWLLYQLTPILESALTFIVEVWKTILNIQIDKFDECGISIASLINTTIVFLASIIESLRNVSALLSCSTFNPIYTTIVYDGICKYGVSGFTVMFWMQFCNISAMLIMVVLRSAW